MFESYVASAFSDLPGVINDSPIRLPIRSRATRTETVRCVA
jgi:hypothetical protein